jgi:hypothetical protein
LKGSDINLDYQRRERIGFDEAIFCDGKSNDQLARILDEAREKDVSLLLTRFSASACEALEPRHRSAMDYDTVSRTAYFGVPYPIAPGPARVAVVTAGTSDTPVGREVARTLYYFGQDMLEIQDVGVAGLWRLLDRINEISEKSVVIVVAGMDGALPTVICGLVPGLVIAVPTSVGYGVSDGGRAALHTALASCAPGLLTVNIDNGYGAACAALRAIAPTRPGAKD